MADERGEKQQCYVHASKSNAMVKASSDDGLEQGNWMKLVGESVEDKRGGPG